MACSSALGYLTYNANAFRILLKECRNKPNQFLRITNNISRDASINPMFLKEFQMQQRVGLPSLRYCLYISEIAAVDFFKIFCHTCSMQKFLGQASNPCHSSDLNHSSDNAGSKTHQATRELLKLLLSFCFLGPHLWHMEVPRLEVESEL